MGFRGRLVLVTALGAAWRLGYLLVAKADQPLLLNDSIYFSIQAGLNSEGHWFEDALTGQPGAEHGMLTSLYLTPWSLGRGGNVVRVRVVLRLAHAVVGVAGDVVRPQVVARERHAVVDVDVRGGGTIRVPNSPWRFSSAPDVGVSGIPKYRGEDNRSLLTELLGYDDARLDELEAGGVLSSRLPDA